MVSLESLRLSEAKISREKFQRALPYEERRDRMIFSLFPGFVTIFAVVTLVWFLSIEEKSVAIFLYILCWSYTLGFTMLGIVCVFYTRASVIRARYVFCALALGSVLMGALMWVLFGQERLGVNLFISQFLGTIVDALEKLSPVSITIGVSVIVFIVTLSTYGIASVTVAYFRRYYPRILLSMMTKKDSKLKRGALKFFGVPSIIDVTDVVLESEPSDGRFDIHVFYDMTLYETIVGLTIASYLFLNPVFLGTMEFLEMMGAIFMMSLFLIVFVAPCGVLKRLKAKALSDAPRPYILWTGMKNRMFQGYILLAIFITLLWISVFTGQDLLRIVSQYVGYFLSMFLIAILVSFIYTNSFYMPFKRSIELDFYELKSDYLSMKEEKDDDVDI